VTTAVATTAVGIVVVVVVVVVPFAFFCSIVVTLAVFEYVVCPVGAYDGAQSWRAVSAQWAYMDG
jgi:hypothetical protein